MVPEVPRGDGSAGIVEDGDAEVVEDAPDIQIDVWKLVFD
jgi:hypothetical protein